MFNPLDGLGTTSRWLKGLLSSSLGLVLSVTFKIFYLWAMAELIHTVIQDPQSWLEHILQYIESLGAIGAIVFIGVYIIATVAFLPGSILTLGAGVIFGVVQGSIYVFIGATLGATLAFWTGRYLLRGFIAKKIAANPRFAAIDRAVGKAGFKIVLLTRLSPVFPFNLLNYMYGLTQVKTQDYVLGSIGMIPGTLMYVYIGSLFGNLAELFSQSQHRTKTPLELILYGIGLMITIGVTLYVTRIARTALQESLD